jgi:hypothetical protein
MIIHLVKQFQLYWQDDYMIYAMKNHTANSKLMKLFIVHTSIIYTIRLKKHHLVKGVLSPSSVFFIRSKH